MGHKECLEWCVEQLEETLDREPTDKEVMDLYESLPEGEDDGE